MSSPFEEWVERLVEFLTVCIHTLLYVRNIYPESIFEQRRYLGMSCWQSRHPDINNYVNKVIDNSRSLIESNLVERFIFATEQNGKCKDHTSIKCCFESEFEFDETYRALLEEEFRASILSLGLLGDLLGRSSEGNSTYLITEVLKLIEL
jgi:hypothetical protein